MYITIGTLKVKVIKVKQNMFLVGFKESTGVYKERWIRKPLKGLAV